MTRPWRPICLSFLLLAGGGSLLALAQAPSPPPRSETDEPPKRYRPGPRFADRTEALGLQFVHRHFGTGQKWMPENMGSGVAVFDSNHDGRLDLYFVQGAPLDGSADSTATNRLWRQREDGAFVDATAGSGLGDSGYGMGAAFGDIDRDGHLDVFVTNFGPDRLYRSCGDGTFEDITARAGIDTPGWSTGATFFDADGDGDLDLYIVGYVDFTFDNHKWCGNARRGIRSYCHPDVYDGAPDHLYLNLGDGTFDQVSLAWKLQRSTKDKGLSVLSGDFDDNGRQDLYVANDSTMNYLYLATEDNRYEESALFTGLGFNAAGKSEASMGIARGDLDGDLRPEIFLTHLDQETNTLYKPWRETTWRDTTDASGLAAPSLPWVGFGTVFFDADLDGDLDIAVANGHIIDNIELFDASRQHRQPAQYFENDGKGRFRESSETLGLYQPLVGRGLVSADLDQDGDLDLVLTQNGGPAKVLINQSRPGKASVTVRLRGRESNPQGFGARVEARCGSRRQTHEMTAASSYLSQGPPEIYLGFGDSTPCAILDQITIHWPSGQVDTHESVKAGGAYTYTEGTSTHKTETFRKPRPSKTPSSRTETRPEGAQEQGPGPTISRKN